MQQSPSWTRRHWQGRRRGWVPWLVDGLLALVCATAIAGDPSSWFGQAAAPRTAPAVDMAAPSPTAHAALEPGEDWRPLNAYESSDD